MNTENLFTEENLKGMEKLFARICKEDTNPSADDLKYSLNAMYDTVNSELIDQRETEDRLEKFADEDSDMNYFYVLSGLRYTPLIYLSAKDGDQEYGPSFVYEGIEEGVKESEAMPLFTRKKMVGEKTFEAYHWHHTDLDTALASAKESGFKYIVVNPDSSPLLMDIAKAEDLVAFFREMDDCIAQAMHEGVAAEDLFPAFVEKFYLRNVECAFKDGSTVTGFAIIPEDDTAAVFEIETDDGDDVPVRLEDLASIRTTDEETYDEYEGSEAPVEETGDEETGDEETGDTEE